MADVAKGIGSLVKANQAGTHARIHTHIQRIRKRSNFSSSHVAGTHLPAFLPSSASSLAPLSLHFVPSYPPTSLSASSPLAPAIEVYIYIHARISPVSGEKKGVFLEITTGEYLEEEHPSRFRSGGERGGSPGAEKGYSRGSGKRKGGEDGMEGACENERGSEKEEGRKEGEGGGRETGQPARTRDDRH